MASNAERAPGSDLAEDEDRAVDPVGLPSWGRLEKGEHFGEAVLKIAEHMIAIHADPVARVEGGGGISHQNGAGQKRLELPLGCKDALEVA
jgi:hypothetical protein